MNCNRCLILLVHVDDLLEVEAEDDDDRLVEGGGGAGLLDVAVQEVVEEAALVRPAEAVLHEEEEEEREEGEHHVDGSLISVAPSCSLASDCHWTNLHSLLNTSNAMSSLAKFSWLFCWMGRRGGYSRQVFPWSFISILEKFSPSRGRSGMTKYEPSPSCSVEVGNWICTAVARAGR